MGVRGVMAIGAAIGVVGCCGASAFDREIRFEAGVVAIDGPPETGVEVYAIRVGDTATVSAQAFETYFGDYGCSPRGPLEPPSPRAPDRYAWSSSASDVVQIDERGRIHAAREGEALLHVAGGGAEGAIRVRVLPRFEAVRIVPERAEVAPGDTVGFTVEALDAEGRRVPGVDFRSAGLRLDQPAGTTEIAANSIYSRLDDDPVHFVFLAVAPGTVTRTARARVIGATGITAQAELLVR